jgi:DNA polymerase V
MKIMTRTTGFASPAADYAHERLALCEDTLADPYFTFFFRVDSTLNHPGFKSGDILVVSRKAVPENGQLCVGVENSRFAVYKYGQDIKSHWGVITEIMPGT